MIGVHVCLMPVCRPLPHKHAPLDLPDHVIVAMLEHDALLTKGLLWSLDYQRAMDKKKLESLQLQQSQVRNCTS